MNLKDIQEKAIQLIKETGAFIQEERKKITTSSIEYKGHNDLVSYVDKESEKKLVASLHHILPEAGFITEEGTTEIGRKDRYNWVIDPVDGTTNFLHGLPIYCISVALMEYEQVILGVVYDPSRDECFHAIRDGKAYRNEEEIRVSTVHALSESLLATGFPHRSMDRIGDYLKILGVLMKETHGLRRMGSAAIDLAYVACGRFEGFFEFNLKPWDVAAGAFIIERAGGKVSAFAGSNNYIFGGQIIAAGHVHQEMKDVINQFWHEDA
jgi:myo-inositol-1(or 4)-monophosphatase